jgi:hypothetical protein
MEEIKAKVLQIIQDTKASYRKDAYERADISDADLAIAIDLLVAEGLLKKNKRGAVSLIGGRNLAADRRALAFHNLSTSNPFNK